MTNSVQLVCHRYLTLLRSTVRVTVPVAAVAMVIATSAVPTCAWKAKAHVFLADIALQDAKDGTVSIYCGTSKIGDYAVEPKILTAIRNYPGAFYAGALGPDAYPDILTGQMLIHPAGYTSRWLNYLAAEGLSYNDARCAFAAGFFAHAAGDLFGHDWVNSWAGGAFSYHPDPRVATRHITVEGYVENKLPPTIPASSISISGLETWMYQKMVFANTGTTLDTLLFRGDNIKYSLPYVFSRLRRAIQSDINAYYAKKASFDSQVEAKKKAAANCKATDFSCSATKLLAEAAALEVAKAAYMTENATQITYKERWVKDIDDGLKAWPSVSHRVSLALYGGQADAAKAAIEDFATNHLASMAGAPDWLGPMLTASVIPQFVKEAIDGMKASLVNYLCQKAFGMSWNDFRQYLLSPENMMSAQSISKSALDADLRLAGPTIDWTKVPAMVNTVTMIKLCLISKTEVNRLISDLGGWATLDKSNILLGDWFNSLDENSQWNKNVNKMVLASNETLFNKVFVPSSYGTSSSQSTPSSTAPSGGGGGGGGGTPRFK